MTQKQEVLMKTNKGTIKIELDAAKAPITVQNFIEYAEAGHYDGTIFHRVIDNFMVQGGGFLPNMDQKETRQPIKNEANNGLKNKRGTIAMARTGVVDSATAQFFINIKDNDFLDFSSPTQQGYGYCVFGTVVEGIEVVDAIRAVKTGRQPPYDDVPLEPVIIEKVVLVGAVAK